MKGLKNFKKGGYVVVSTHKMPGQEYYGSRYATKKRAFQVANEIQQTGMIGTRVRVYKNAKGILHEHFDF